MRRFNPKKSNEVQILSFDFSENLQPHETIVYATVESECITGEDIQSKKMVIGPTLTEYGKVKQKIGHGIDGKNYCLTCTIHTSLGQILTICVELPVGEEPEEDEEMEPELLDEGAEMGEMEDMPMPEMGEEEMPKEHKELETETVEEQEEDSVETKSFNFEATEVKEVNRDGLKFGRIAGYASTYGNIDRVGDAVMPGAFAKTLDRYKKENRPIRMYYQHDDKELIGAFYPSQMREDAKGLYVEGELNLEVQRGREVYALAKQGVLSDMSIGYSIRDFDIKNGIRQLKDIELWEISIVSEPANPEAKISQVKSLDEIREKIKKKSDLERVLRDAGFSRSAAKFIAALTDDQKYLNLSEEEPSEETPCDEVVEMKKSNAEMLETLLRLKAIVQHI